MDTPASLHDHGDPERDDPARGQPGSFWPDPAGAYDVGPGTLALLADLAFGAPLVAQVLDAYLLDRGADPARRWRLVLTSAVVVPDDGNAGRDGRPHGPPGGPPVGPEPERAWRG